MTERRRSRKLGPVEILVVVSVWLLFVAVILAGSRKSRVDARRIECGKNLSVIGNAMQIYANDYDGAFPRSGGIVSTWNTRIWDWSAANRFRAFGLARDGYGGIVTISSCFYLLVKYAGVEPSFFVCPGEEGMTEFKLAQAGVGNKTLADLWDFGPTPTIHCSYSYHMPFGLYPLTTTSKPGLALAGDRNPWIDTSRQEKISDFIPASGAEAAKIGNSTAHDKEGQNVLFVDGHVSFEDYAYCGINNDNIYTFWDGGDIRRGAPATMWSTPQDLRDSLLVNESPAYRREVTREVEPVDTTELKQTAVVATLECPMPEHKNVIWCSTFQIAWDKLKNDVIGEPLKVRNAEEIASRLNRGQFDPRNLEDKSFYSTAGIVKDGIVDQIQKEMARRFPEQPKYLLEKLDNLSRQFRQQLIVAYSFLSLGIDFEYPFCVNERAFEFRDSNGVPNNVTSFREFGGPGTSEPVSDQVDVLYFRDFEKTGNVDFVVDLSRNTKPYQIVLARMRWLGTLSESVAAVEEKISEFEADPDYDVLRNFKAIDSLIVPDVLYKLIHNFEELEDQDLLNTEWPDYFFVEAMQMIHFRLCRTGVILRSEALMGAGAGIAPPRRQIIEPRLFHFNSPFLIYVKKRGAESSPFFVMWVDNAELMQRF